jgi:CRP/FNR family cyclic AMP-dependent transcriptional regulator
MIIEYLKNNPFFEDLTHEELERVSEVCSVESFSRGNQIFSEGAPGDNFYIIVSGGVRIQKKIPKAGSETLRVLKAGEEFGEMALVEEMPRSASAVADEDLQLVCIGKPDLDRLFGEHHSIAVKILKVFCKTMSARLRESSERMIRVFEEMGIEMKDEESGEAVPTKSPMWYRIVWKVIGI